jgi:hypothetical protein
MLAWVASLGDLPEDEYDPNDGGLGKPAPYITQPPGGPLKAKNAEDF